MQMRLTASYTHLPVTRSLKDFFAESSALEPLRPAIRDVLTMETGITSVLSLSRLIKVAGGITGLQVCKSAVSR